MNTKGDVWVSAILYFGLGIILLTIILSAGTPVINRLRDKNIVIQTKEVMHVLDGNIREVAREGPGSQRPVTVDIRKGEFKVDEATDRVEWTYRTKALLSEPCSPLANAPDTTPRNGVPDVCEANVVQEGTLNILTTGAKGDYTVRAWLDYSNQVFLVVPSTTQQIVGRSELLIRHGGLYCITNEQTKTKAASDSAECTALTKPKTRTGVVISARQ